MKYKNYKLKFSSKPRLAISFILLILSNYSCTEEFDFKTESFESALVVQATLTNELSKQKVFLSRTFAFEDDGPPPESNATVLVTESTGLEYTFVESELPGNYKSTIPFAAVVGRQYTLKITTQNGRIYQSTTETSNAGTTIDQVYAERSFNAENNDGVSIFIDSYDPANNSKYYRFEYEETYKIVSPYISPQNLAINENQQIVIVPKTEEETTCYSTQTSNNIALASTTSLGEDRLSRFPIRFLDARNPKIGNRYSILVRQFVITREAFTFYETLKNFSGSASLFSQVQPGFVAGNIISLQSENEKVIGFFEVSTVSQKRIFFNYRDLFDDGSLPQPFATGCEATRPPLAALIGLIQSNDIKYFYTPSDPPAQGEGPYLVLPTGCIDCREFGSNIVPVFWEE